MKKMCLAVLLLWSVWFPAPVAAEKAAPLDESEAVPAAALTGLSNKTTWAADPEGDFLADALWTRLRAMPKALRPKVALVLGGGGARGLAHIGVLKVLEREGVPVDLVVGTSVGAMVGALYAAGMPVEQIEKLGEEIGWNDLTDYSGARLVRLVMTEKLFSTEKMEAYLKRHIGDKKFVDLKIPLACVAADLRTGEKIVLREGSVALAARASATLPGFFRPVPYRHRLLVDGGVVDNVPTDVAKTLGAEVILCVSIPADFSRNNVSNVLMTLTQALYIQGQIIADERLALADAVIRPQVSDVTAIELWKSKECIATGEAAARAAMPDIRRALAKKYFAKWVGLRGDARSWGALNAEGAPGEKKDSFNRETTHGKGPHR